MKKFFVMLMMMMLICSVASAIDIQTGGYIEVESTIQPVKGQTVNETLRVAVIDAYRYIAEETGELLISSNSTVENFRLTNDKIRTEIEKSLTGSRVVKKYAEANGVCHAIVRLSLYGGENSLANVVLPKNVQIEAFPKPKTTNIESASLNSYTGLIIDCRGLNIATAISPVIKSVSGEKIYAFEQLSRQTVVNMGMVDYSESMDKGINRAGDKPLIVKAISVSGECDAIISQNDADKILLANQSGQFLNNCMVVIVR